MSFITNGCFYGKEKIITDLRTLKAIERRNNGITFDRRYKYVVYNGHIEHGERLQGFNGRNFKLMYFDGCFNPYCVEV